MERAAEKDQILGDYAALMRGLLPAACGFYCHSLEGSVLWASPPPGPGLTGGCLERLAALLKSTAPAPERVALDSGAAYLLPLRSDRGQPLGVLTLCVAGASASMSAADCADVLRPAADTLQRELNLRFRLIDGLRKLSIQAAEEQLLHEVERAVHQPDACEVILGNILALCRHFLQIDSAALLIPDKRISILQGSRLTLPALELMLEDPLDLLVGDGAAQPLERWRGDDLLTISIRQGTDQVGLLALSGWKGADFSERRLSRVSRYIASHIDSVLERGFDRLTGLLAWPAFESIVTAVSRSDAAGDHVLIYFDIDRLHVANESLGRETGDRVLASFATILRSKLAGHHFTRVVSDIFAALLLNTDTDSARTLAEEIMEAFRQLQFGWDDRSYRASVSAGVGPVSGQSGSEAGPLGIAQVACKAAKDRGRGRVEVYQPGDVSIVQRLDDIQLVGYVRNAIDRGRLVLLGQPIAALKEGGAGNYFEVLVRMLDDEDRHISPGDFLSAAERYQLMEELDRWVVANTLKLLSAHRATLAGSDARFAINLSGQSLGSQHFLPYVQEQLAHSGVAPSMLCFEITETVAVANLQRAQAFMQALRQIGCRFSLDDFGTGLSSFGYLKLFPVDTLKIDGSFIRDLPTNVVSQSVVAAIAEVARVMQLGTVAEFVQDEETLVLLRGLGVTWAQGYLIGEPVGLDHCLMQSTGQDVSAGKGQRSSALAG